MTCEILGPGALDYVPCRYGTSKLLFRGPARVLEAPYVAFIGGTQTFGKFIKQPYPLKVEHLTGVTSVNFGQVNAGVDVFLKDPVVLEAARAGRVTVLEVLGAVNLDNRLYRVHMRRNDRFLRASEELVRMYPQVDFSQFSFTNHMLQHLHRSGPEQFAVVERVLQSTWVRRMRQLLGLLGGKVVLLRLGRTDGGLRGGPDQAGTEGGLLTDEMVARLRPLVSAVVDMPVPQASGTLVRDGMVFTALEEGAARRVAGPQVHTAVARALQPVLDSLM